MDNIQNQAPRANQHSTPVDRLRETLDAAGINYTIHAHDQAIESAQDGVERGVGGLANMAPALVLRADEGYLVAIIRGDTRLSYKKIKKRFGLKNLSLATPEQIQQATGSEVRQ
ncbi:MAG TPA: YbaK/EbsC family protein, partial [Anaerolineales bacterium]